MLGLTAGVEEFEGSGPNRDQSSAVQCVVDEYGPTDFTQSYSKSVDAAEVLPKFLGGDLDHERLAHMRASPLNWVTPNAAPMLAIHGTADPYVAYEQSLWIIERLIAAGVPAELETISGAGHGFKGADAQRADDRALAWFDKYLKPAARAPYPADLRSRAERRDCRDRMAFGCAAVEGPQRSWPRRAGAAQPARALHHQSAEKGGRTRWRSQRSLVLLGGPGASHRRAAPSQRQHADQRRQTRQSDRGDAGQASRLEIRECRPREHALAQRAPHGAGHYADRRGGGGQNDRSGSGRIHRLAVAGAERQGPQALHGPPACEWQHCDEPFGSRRVGGGRSLR